MRGSGRVRQGRDFGVLSSTQGHFGMMGSGRVSNRILVFCQPHRVILGWRAVEELVISWILVFC